MRCHTAIVAMAIMFGAIGQARSELLVNGGAEDGDVSVGWTADSNAMGRIQEGHQSHGFVRPYEGDWFWMCAAEPAEYASMWQTGTTGLDAPRFHLSGFVHTEVYGDGQNDFGVATLSFLDSEGQEISSISTDHLVGEAWNSFALDLAVPDTAAIWNVTLAGTRQWGGVINVFYDSVSLDAVPEPSTISLFTMFGVVGTFVAWRKRRRT